MVVVKLVVVVLSVVEALFVCRAIEMVVLLVVLLVVVLLSVVEVLFVMVVLLAVVVLSMVGSGFMQLG